MRKAVLQVVIGVILILSVIACYKIVSNYIDAKDAVIAAQKAGKQEWADKALRYQSEAMRLGYELEDLDKSTNWLYEEIKKVQKENERLQAEPTIEPLVEPKIPLLVDIIPSIKAGVVHLKCPQWQGSAFVIGPRTLVTARHCVEGVEDFKITTDDEHLLHATRAISSEKHDLAFIYIDDLTCQNDLVEHGCRKNEHKVVLKPTEFGSIAECQLGQRIVTIGSGYGKININSVTLGIISGLGRDYDELNDDYYGVEDYGWSVAFQTDSPGHPGNSGCPVFTPDGVVRGILVGGFSPSLIICMPCDLFMDDIEEINRMFIQGKYYREVETTGSAYYNYEKDNEYYTVR